MSRYGSKQHISNIFTFVRASLLDGKVPAADNQTFWKPRNHQKQREDNKNEDDDDGITYKSGN